MSKLIYKFILYTKLFFKKIKGAQISVEMIGPTDTDDRLFEKLYAEHSPVIIIKDFIPKASIPHIIQGLQTSEPPTVEKDIFGYCYGQNLMTAKDLPSYLDNEAGYTDYLSSITLDYDQLINDKLQRHTSLPIERVYYGEKKYFSSTIRFLKPRKGGIKIHTELLHYELFDSCKHISTLLNLQNEISAFCVLQKPEAGGKLRLYNCTFNETQKIPFEELRYNYVQSSDYIEINPEVGDLVLFGGGQRWHCITEIEGNTNRITIGNFFCFNKENNKIFYWS